MPSVSRLSMQPATSGGKLHRRWRVTKGIDFDLEALSERPFAENHV
jgi:hypothetical protein